jgi:hypothetical protein
MADPSGGTAHGVATGLAALLKSCKTSNDFLGNRYPYEMAT